MKRLAKKHFKLPNATTLNGRKSTIAKAFSDGVAPRQQPTLGEYEEYLAFFPKINGNHICAYCGGRFEYFEHFRPLVIKSEPTGYGSDIYNLVPSCGYCNVRKSNLSWQDWMNNDSNQGKNNLSAHAERWEKLREFENWGKDNTLFIDYEKVVGSEKWQQYLKDYKTICNTLSEMYSLQKTIKSIVVKEIKRKKI